MERWHQKLYARFVFWLARKSWRACVHGENLVLNLDGPYPVCALCFEELMHEWSEKERDEYYYRLISLLEKS